MAATLAALPAATHVTWPLARSAAPLVHSRTWNQAAAERYCRIQPAST